MNVIKPNRRLTIFWGVFEALDLPFPHSAIFHSAQCYARLFPSTSVPFRPFQLFLLLETHILHLETPSLLCASEEGSVHITLALINPGCRLLQFNVHRVTYRGMVAALQCVQNAVHRLVFQLDPGIIISPVLIQRYTSFLLKYRIIL